MTEQEVREVIKLHGWSFLRRERRSRSYAYAARKMRGKRIEIYISTFTKFAHLTLDQLRKKLEIVVPSNVNDEDTVQCYPAGVTNQQSSEPIVPMSKFNEHTYPGWRGDYSRFDQQ